MAGLSLKANPTFKVKVGVPVPGAAPVPVEFTFKHRTKTQLEEFIASRSEKTDLESVMDMVCGWDLEEAFNEEGVGLLLENYAGAALAIYLAYIEELLQAKRKN